MATQPMMGSVQMPMMGSVQLQMPQHQHQQYQQQYQRPQQQNQQQPQQPPPQVSQERAAPQASQQASMQAQTSSQFKPARPDANGLINRSSVIKDTKPWYNQTLMVPHEAIRYWMEKLELNTTENPTFDFVAYPWKADNLFTWYNEYFYPFVHHHHDIEEEMMTPWMKSKGLVFPDKIMQDHVALVGALDKVKTYEQQYYGLLKSGAADKDQKIRQLTQSLKDHIRQMNAHMRDHLAEEEVLYPPALRDGVSEKDFWRLEGKILRSFSMAENEKVLPLVCHAVRDWGGAGFLHTFEQKIPGPIRYFLNKNWKPKFYNYTEPLLDSLNSTNKPNLVKPTPGCCSIS